MEADSSFVSLFQSRNTIGRLVKTYLNRPIEILRKISKIFHINSKYFCLFNNMPLASWLAHITRDFLTCYSCSYYSSMLLVKIWNDDFLEYCPLIRANFESWRNVSIKSYNSNLDTMVMPLTIENLINKTQECTKIEKQCPWNTSVD